jgi:steroid delta-isomerase-like uncharacterized protein
MRQDTLIVMALVAMLCGCAATREASAPADARALEHVLEEWTLAWSSGDVARVLRLYADDVYYEDVPFEVVRQGRGGVRDFATSIFGGFSDVRFERKSRFVSADGRSGTIEWVWRGRQVKDFPRLPATNKPFEVRGVTIVQFRDGLIVRNSNHWDLTLFLRQVGLQVSARPNPSAQDALAKQDLAHP